MSRKIINISAVMKKKDFASYLSQCYRLYKKGYFVSPFKLFKYYSKWKKGNSKNFNPFEKPAPWFNFEALKFLDTLLKSDFRVFEYGSGVSTIYFANKVKEVISVEHNEKWFEEVESKIKSFSNTKVLLEKPERQSTDAAHGFPTKFSDTIRFPEPREYSFEGYVCSIEAFPDGYFDLIVVDGRCRETCLKISEKKLSNKGILVLDNSQRTRYKSAIKDIENNFSKKKKFFGPVTMSRAFEETTFFLR